MTKWRLVFLVMLAAPACDPVLSDPEATDLVVVEAYIFAGEAVDNVRLTTVTALGADTVEADPINDADVLLIKNGVSYRLTATGDSGYYAYGGTDLTVDEGDRFRLEVTYYDRVAFGETDVPEPPVDVVIDSDQLMAPVFGGGRPGQGGRGGGGFDLQERQVLTTWSNLDQRLHFVVVEGEEDDTESIFPDALQGRIGRFRFISEPTLDDFYSVGLVMLEQLGRHEVTVYRVNEEYADLYENRVQDSRDLNEPPSNITDGLGVFSAFNSRSVFFDVVREASQD